MLPPSPVFSNVCSQIYFSLKCHILAMNLELGTFNGPPHGAPQFCLWDENSLIIFPCMECRQSLRAQGELDYPKSSVVDQEGNAGWDLRSLCWMKNQDMSSSRQSTTCSGQPCLLPLTCSWLTFNFSHSPWPHENSHGQWDGSSPAKSDSSKLGRFNKSRY